MSDRRLYVSFKIAEICNLVCDYCYFFFLGDESYKEHPKLISAATVEAVGQFLGEGARDLGINTVAVAMHGGEPLLVGKKRFTDFCEILERTVNPHTRLAIALQTNGVLLDEEWLRICGRFKIRVGISLDGPKPVNDRSRIDRKGRGSYDKIVRGIRKAQQAAADGVIEPPGALIVIRPDTSAREIYRHVVHDLGLKRLDFMLPKDNWDSHSPEFTRFLEGYSLDLLNCWLEDDDPTVNIRSIKQMFAPFLTDVALDVRTNYLADMTEAICIRSNGDVCPDDTLPAVDSTFCTTGFNVHSATLGDFYQAPFWSDIRQTVLRPPEECTKCEWMGVCGGGEIVTRFSKARKFDNPTIYCTRNKLLYGRIREYVLKYIDAAVITERLERSRKLMFGLPAAVPGTNTSAGAPALAVDAA